MGVADGGNELFQILEGAAPDAVVGEVAEHDHLVRRIKHRQRRSIRPVQEKHRHQEWLKFLRTIDQTIPANKQIYLICDNYATHKHARVQRWLKADKRLHVRFTPTSASWLNMIERSFRDLTHHRIRRSVFLDLEQLITAIGDYVDAHNKNPKPFIWTAKANDILQKVTRAQTALNKRRSA